LGWVQMFLLVVGWIGLGQSAGGFGWIGSHKIDPQTTLTAMVGRESGGREFNSQSGCGCKMSR